MVGLNQIIQIFLSLGILVCGSKSAYFVENYYVISKSAAALAEMSLSDTQYAFMKVYPEWWASFLGEIADHQKQQGNLYHFSKLHLIDPKTLPMDLRVKYFFFHSEYSYHYEINKSASTSNPYHGLGKTSTIVLGTVVLVFIAKLVFFNG